MTTEEDCKSLLRSVLQSSTRPIPIHKLEHEYQLITGNRLAFVDFGYNSLIDFLKSSSDTVKLSCTGNTTVVQAVTTDDTAHLTRLVNQQKKTTKTPFRSPNQYRSASQHQSRGGYNRYQRMPPLKPSYQSKKSYPRISSNLPTNKDFTVNQGLQPRCSENLNSVYEVPPRMQKRQHEREFMSPLTPQDNIHVRVECGNNQRGPTRSVLNTFSSVPPTEQREPSQPHSPVWSETERRVTPPRAEIHPTRRPVKSATTTPQLSQSPRKSAATPSSQTKQKTKLAELAAQRDLGAVTYKTLTTRLGDERHFITRVVVGSRSFNSYPTVSMTAADSEEEAARCALEDLDSVLREKCDELPISPVSCIVRRVHELIQDQPNGFYTSHILDLYRLKYQERLPDSWIALLLCHDSFDVTKINDKKTIVAPRKHEYREMSNDDSGSSVCSRASSPGVSSKPPLTPLSFPEIVLPSEPYWEVYVSYVASTDSVFLRLIGPEFSDKYETLAADLDMYYFSAPVVAPPVIIEVNDPFAVICDSCWSRVVIQEVLSNDKFLVKFVDHGDLEIQSRSDLRPLAPQFLELPPQAVCCQLAGLEDLNDPETVLSLTNLTVGKTLVAKVELGEELVVILYDTSTDENVNINQKILEIVLSHVPMPELNAGITEVVIDHVTDNGDIYVQTDFRVVELLSSLTEMAVRSAQAVIDLVPGTVYLALDSASNLWRRCELLNHTRDANNKKIFVVYVDYGYQEEVATSAVRQLNSVNILHAVPFQAIKCRLSGVPSTPDLEWCHKTSTKLRQLVAENASVIVRVVADAGADVPQVVAVVRDVSTNVALSVNDTLNQQPDLFEKKGSRLGVCDHEIECIALPSKKEMVQIHVTLAASPYNFVFQLWNGGEQFENLEMEMKEFYSRNKGVAIAMSDIRANATYAAFHKGNWFRVSVNYNENLQINNCVSIYFVDYGDHTLTSLTFLRKLDESFRRLPSQALRGKMAGIVPIYKDWQTEDSLRFKELVEEKRLWATVVDFEAEAESHQPKLVVRLVDTSDPENDVFIDNVLVAENRARLIDATYWERLSADV